MAVIIHECGCEFSPLSLEQLKSCGKHITVKDIEFCPDLRIIRLEQGCGRWSRRIGAIFTWNTYGTKATCKFCGCRTFTYKSAPTLVDVQLEVE